MTDASTGLASLNFKILLVTRRLRCVQDAIGIFFSKMINFGASCQLTHILHLMLRSLSMHYQKSVPVCYTSFSQENLESLKPSRGVQVRYREHWVYQCHAVCCSLARQESVLILFMRQEGKYYLIK